MFKKKTLSLSIAMVAALGSSYVAVAQEDDGLEEVVVTGIRSSMSKALDIKRENTQIVDAIVAEDIGKFPDNNVIEAMSHITGVQVGVDVKGEGSSVVIRGSGDIVTTINGQQVFTGVGRGMALQDVPATLVAGIEVYKSTSADMIEGGVGGLVNVRMRRAFDFDGFKTAVSLKGTYNDQSEEIDPNLSALVSNRWDTSAGEFGALLNVAYMESNYREEAVWGGGFFPYTEAGVPIAGSTPGVALDTSPDNDYVLMRDAAGAWDRYGLNKRPAVNVSLQWAPSDSLETYLDMSYQGYEGKGNMSFLFTRTDAQQKPGTSYTYHEGTNVVKTAQTINAFLLTSTQAYEAETDSMQYTTGANWDVNEKLNVKADLNYQKSTFDNTGLILDFTRNAPTLNVDFNQNGAVALDYGDLDLTSTDGVGVATFFDGWTHSKGTAYAAKVDADYLVDFGPIEKLEFGVRYSSRNAENQDVQNVRCCGPLLSDPSLNGIVDKTPGDFMSGVVTFPRQWLTPSVDWMLDAKNQDTLRSLVGFNYTGRPAYDPTRYFDITEDTTAIYAQFHYAFDLAGKTVDGVVGSRVVNTSSDLTGFQIDGDTNVANQVTLNADDTVVLPNASFRISLTDTLTGRINASQTLTRPAFGDLNPALTLRAPIAGQINQGTGSGGNPNLEPIVATNFDVALEWYFADDSALTGTIFNRNFTDTIVRKTTIVDIGGVPYRLDRPENSGESDYTGYEVGFQYFPDNLPAVLQGLGIQSSYTYIDGELTPEAGAAKTELFNVSKKSYSAALAYEKERFGARISYVYRDAFKGGENYCCSMPIEIMAQDYGSTDVSMSYNVTDDIILTLDATNIFGDNFQDYFGDATLFNRDTVRFAKTVSAGIRASF